ncbi:MAG: hypothetical protein HY826_00455 [Actinobacteria bacterium]|nr:hypothetical protein [Actinomycetota bacterium]
MRSWLTVASVALVACSTPSGASTASTATTVVATSTSVADNEIVIPPGILAAMPFQNRLDVAQGIFQMKLYNGTEEALPVVGVQLVWEALTTPVSHRTNMLIAGDRLDFPVPLAAANCVGDGTIADMPDPHDGYVRVLLADGSEVHASVFDVLHFARKLYLQDCERQFIGSQVDIEWVDLHEAILDGRPVTEGSLRLTRLAGEGAVTIALIRATIIFTFVAPAAIDGVVAVLPEGLDAVDVPVRFTEGRCDAHASSEVSQPFEFSATLDLGDGRQRSFALPIPKGDQVAMRGRVEAGCEYLGKTGTLGP